MLLDLNFHLSIMKHTSWISHILDWHFYRFLINKTCKRKILQLFQLCCKVKCEVEAQTVKRIMITYILLCQMSKK